MLKDMRSVTFPPLQKQLLISTADQEYPDIVYMAYFKLWACCGTSAEGNVTCNTPTDHYLEGPSPEELVAITSGYVPSSTSRYLSMSTLSSSSKSGVSTTIESASSSVMVVSSTTPTTAQSTDVLTTGSGLSTGAKAGIGVGTVLGALVINAVLIVLFLKFRRRPNSRGISETTTPENTGAVTTYVCTKHELPAPQSHILDHGQKACMPTELDASQHD